MHLCKFYFKVRFNVNIPFRISSSECQVAFLPFYRAMGSVLCHAVLSHCHVWLFTTPWTADLEAPLSMGILQARILKGVTMPSSRASPQPRDQTQVSHIVGRFFTVWVTKEAQACWSGQPIPSPGDLPDPGVEPGSPALQSYPLPVKVPGKSNVFYAAVSE